MSGVTNVKRAGEVSIRRVDKSELIDILRNSPKMAAFLGIPACLPGELEGILAQLSADSRQDISMGELTSFFSGTGSGAPSAASSSRLDECGKCARSPRRSCSCSPKAKAGPEEKRAERPWALAPELLAGLPADRLNKWISSLKDAPVYGGLLGFHVGNELTMRCSLLFRDRLDSWDSIIQAVGGHLARSRIALRDVQAIEMVRGGFVLNCKGRRTTLHLPSGGDASGWSGALHSLLPAHPTLARAGGKPRPGATGKRRQSSFVPRCANVTPPPWRRGRSPEGTPRITMVVSHENAGSRDAIRINTHRDGLQAGRLLHGADAVVRPRHGSPVAGKVNERAGSLEAARAVAGKITGQRQLSRRGADGGCSGEKVTGPRLRSLTPRRAPEVCGKITGERRSLTPQGARPQGAAKVTDLGGERAASRARSASPPAGKITDAGRAALGAARRPAAPQLDRLRPFGSPLSGARRGAPEFARILF